MSSDIPDAIVTAIGGGSGILTEDYSLTCSVQLTEGLIGFTNNLTLEKMTTDDNYSVLDYSTTTSSITLDLSPLTTTDTGTYKCTFYTVQDTINYERTFEDSTNVTATSKPVCSVLIGIFMSACLFNSPSSECSSVN